jgi:hypothetical protein
MRWFPFRGSNFFDPLRRGPQTSQLRSYTSHHREYGRFHRRPLAMLVHDLERNIYCPRDNQRRHEIPFVRRNDLSIPQHVSGDHRRPHSRVCRPCSHPGNALRFAILPIFLPVPYGVSIPSGNFAANTLDDSFSDTVYPFGRIWMTAMAHIHSTNAGRPFHLHRGLFQADTVIGTPTPDGPKDFSDYTLATNLSPSISTLQVWDPLYKVAFDHCRKCLPLTATIETPVSTTLPSPPSTDPDLLAVLVKALTKTISSDTHGARQQG